MVDILSPDGANVGGVNPWFASAAERAQRYELDPAILVRAVTPPYFLLTKLAAFFERGPDVESSKDVEDIVALATEVPTLADDILAEGVEGAVAQLWRAVFERYDFGPADIADVVDWHLDARDGDERKRVIQALLALSHGSG